MKSVVIGSDHAGFKAKEEVKQILQDLNITVEDMGVINETPIDYPIIAKKVCKRVLLNPSFGILICGSGEGMQMAANKIKGIRAGFCYDIYSAKKAREDNNANVLTLRAREFDHALYKPIIDTFLHTQFSKNVRHKRRVAELFDLDLKK